jgi:hypothetical protein
MIHKSSLDTGWTDNLTFYVDWRLNVDKTRNSEKAEQFEIVWKVQKIRTTTISSVYMLTSSYLVRVKQLSLLFSCVFLHSFILYLLYFCGCRTDWCRYFYFASSSSYIAVYQFAPRIVINLDLAMSIFRTIIVTFFVSENILMSWSILNFQISPRSWWSQKCQLQRSHHLRILCQKLRFCWWYAWARYTRKIPVASFMRDQITLPDQH